MLTGVSIPVFSLAPILVLIFAIYFQILPISEWSSAKHMVLPVLTLAIPFSSVLARVLRQKLLTEANGPFVLVLKTKGLSDFEILLMSLLHRLHE